LPDCLIMLPMRCAAAVCELEGPRITGPITSLKILGACVAFILRLKITVVNASQILHWL